MSSRVAGAAPPLEAALQAGAERFPELGRELRRRNAHEPYRQFFRLARERLRASSRREPEGYADAGELLADLRLAKRALNAQRAQWIAAGDLHDVIREVEVFGFHLARLDIREHASRHRQAIAGLFAHAGFEPHYGDLDEDARCSLLAPALAAEARLVPADTIALPPVAREVLDTFAMLRDALSSGYGDALGAYVISGAAAPSDVLEVLLLMKETGLAAVGGTRAALPIAPFTDNRRDVGRAEAAVRTEGARAPACEPRRSSDTGLARSCIPPDEAAETAVPLILALFRWRAPCFGVRCWGAAATRAGWRWAGRVAFGHYAGGWCGGRVQTASRELAAGRERVTS